MKSYKNIKNLKITIFHYTCCKTGGQKDVQKQNKKKNRPEKERKKSKISFDVLQNMCF